MGIFRSDWFDFVGAGGSQPVTGTVSVAPDVDAGTGGARRRNFIVTATRRWRDFCGDSGERHALFVHDDFVGEYDTVCGVAGSVAATALSGDFGNDAGLDVPVFVCARGGNRADESRPAEPDVSPATLVGMENFSRRHRAIICAFDGARGTDLFGNVCARLEMTPALEVRDLSFRYPDGREALAGVSFTVNPGECVGLIGPNGAGKSTLLLHLNGILPEQIQAPVVFVAGMPVTEENLPTIRRQVGLLFQDADDQLFCPTVFEDVAFGPQQFGLDEAKVREALAKVGLAGYEQRSPQHLSRGEKRRVCLAGVLACNPQVLVLDEPTADLDPRGRRELKDLLRQIPATKLIASHDLELVVELCPRSLVLDGGKIVADGATRALLDDSALMLRHGLERPHILQHHHPH